MAPVCVLEALSVASVMQYLYPSLAFVSFLAIRSIVLYSRPTSTETYRTVKRPILLALVAVIIGTFLASSINMLVRALKDLPWGVDEYKSLYIMFASLVWTIQVLYWPLDKDYTLMPYVVSSVICAVGEVVILEYTLSKVDHFDFFDTVSLNIQGIRVAALLAIPCIYLGQIVSELDNIDTDSGDLERQPLLAEIAHPEAAMFSQGPSEQIRRLNTSDSVRSAKGGLGMTTDGPVPATDEAEPSLWKPKTHTKPILRPIVMKDETLAKIEEHTEPSPRTEELTCIGPRTNGTLERPKTPTKKGSVAAKVEQIIAKTNEAKNVDKGKSSATSSTRCLVHSGTDKSNASEAGSNQGAANVSTGSAAANSLRKVSQPRRDRSASPSKSTTSVSSRHPKLKADVPEFVPRHLRTSTDASNDFTPGTPASINSVSSSPSRLRAHAPEFVSKRITIATDASTSSIPKSLDPREPRPMSPAKRQYNDIPTGSPTLGRSAKIHRPEFDRSFHLSTSVSGSRGEGSDSSCPRFRDGRQSPALKVGVDTANTQRSPEKPGFVRPKSRVHRRNMSKSEPASQMGSTVDGGQDSENSLLSPVGEGERPIVNLPGMGNRRVTAPSDPPAGEQTTKPRQGTNSSGGNRPKTPNINRRRHWRYKQQGSRSSGMSGRQSMSQSHSSMDGSGDTGRVPRPPQGSPTVGPVERGAFGYGGMGGVN